MQLLELEFENFKSFKGHVTVPFGPGFTCITGPNGSGKSNITDAILFILGSRSTKLLRARRLNQLIFGYQEGKKSRSTATHCRVSMVFDNSDRFLSIESDRVRFTKGVRMRGGKPATYYRLNGDTSSAGEFEALFSRAGLYATGYNIIQQGDVMQTSLMSGTERRRKLEDVAGITAYDQRLRKTRSAREHVGADLTLLDERMREAQRLLRQLEREKRDAERLEAILQQLQENELQRKWRRVLDLEAELESRRGLIVRHEKELEELVGELEERQTTIGVFEDDYKKVEDEIFDAGGDRARELQEQLDKARVEQALAQSNSESAGARLVELEASRRQLGDARKAAAAELKELRDALDEARAGAGELEAQVTTAASELARLEASAADGSQEISGQRDALDALRQAAGELEMQRHRLEGEREQLERQLQLAREQLERSEQLLKAAREDSADADFQLQDLELGRKSAADNLRKVTAKHGKLVSELVLAADRLERSESELREAALALAAEEAATHARDEIGGYARAVQSVLAARDTGELDGIVGTIAELGQVDGEHALALEVAAGARMQSVVVRDDSVAAEAIAFLKQRKLGRARFLPLNRLRRYRPGANALLLVKQSGAVNFAQELVRFDPRYADAFGNVFGDTVIMRSLDEARSYLGKGRMVTLAGELLEAGGAMVGGSPPRSGIHFGTGTRDNLDELVMHHGRAEAHKLEASAAVLELREELAEVAQAKAALESECSTTQTRVTDFDEQATKSADGLLQAQQSFETRRGALTALEGELDEREAALAELQITITDHAGSVEQAATALQELTGGVAAERLAQLQSALGQQRESLSEARASVARFEAAEEPAAGEEQRLASELEQNLAEQKEQQTLRRDERETARKLALKVKALKAEEDAKFRELKELRDRRDRLRDELAEARTTLAQREEFGRGRRHATDELKIEVATREPKLVEARQRLPEKAEQPPKIGGSEQLEGQRETLEGQRGRLGNVNMLSLEHYRQEEERLARIREDRKQLRREVRRLEALEAKISARKLERFSEVYKHINENFQSTFTELTGGGKAWLELEKPETIFDGGVSIKARMPRKRLFPVEALSGGEKSLVSMAFIFAIQRYDPSPFYLLDEPDQNLDGVNTEHIGRAIALQSAVAQFLVVSLHHAALREAAHVIGVFMADDGVSHLHQIHDVDSFIASLSTEEVAA